MKYKHAEAGGMSFSVILGGTDSWISAPSRLKSKSGKAAPVHFLLDLYGKSMTRRRRRLTEALKKMEAERRPLYLAAADAVIPNSGTVEDAVTAAMEALDEIFSH